MKKRILLVLAILVLVTQTGFAATVYLQPMLGAGGIPMNPERPFYEPIKYVRRASDHKVSDEPYVTSDSRITSGKYSDNQIIALGGVKGLKHKWFGTSDAKTTQIEISAYCDNGFYFVSQSNPSYRRPFQLYVITKASGSVLGSGIFGNRYAEKPGILSDTNRSTTIKFTDIFTPSSASTDAAMWFDIVLVLPGTVKNDILTIGTNTYPLTEASDYSAVVTISLTAKDLNGNKIAPTQVINVPFSGFYSKDVAVKDSSVSMFVHPTAAAGNLNLRNYGRQQIASLEIMGVESYSSSSGDVMFSMFLSSSSDPEKNGGIFRLRKENKSYNEKDNEYNSVPFNVILVDNETLEEHLYYGNEHIPEKTTVSKSNYSTIKVPAEGNLPARSFLITPVGVLKDASHSPSADVYTFSHSSVAYIVIEDNSTVLMSSGRYTSDVYVHVLTL